MVKSTAKKSNKYYQCDSCRFYYKTKELAEKCEKHCKEKHACDINIIKHAVKLAQTTDQ